VSGDARQNLAVAAGLTAWGVLWFGGWIAGGLLFPAYDVPAMIGAALGWVLGAAVCAFTLWVGGVR
jgi:hypothetical protein